MTIEGKRSFLEKLLFGRITGDREPFELILEIPSAAIYCHDLLGLMLKLFSSLRRMTLQSQVR